MSLPKPRAEIYAQVLSLFARALSILIVPPVVAGLFQAPATVGFPMLLSGPVSQQAGSVLLLVISAALVWAWWRPLRAGIVMVLADLSFIWLLKLSQPERGTHWIFIAILITGIFFILSESILPKRT